MTNGKLEIIAVSLVFFFSFWLYYWIILLNKSQREIPAYCYFGLKFDKNYESPRWGKETNLIFSKCHGILSFPFCFSHPPSFYMRVFCFAIAPLGLISRSTSSHPLRSGELPPFTRSTRGLPWVGWHHLSRIRYVGKWQKVSNGPVGHSLDDAVWGVS